MDTTTYSLRAGDTTSDRYYADASRLTDEFLSEASRRVGYLVKQHHATTPTQDESCLELLALGVLWRQYGSRALVSHWPVRKALSCLGWLRQQGNVCKSAADGVKGLLITMFNARGRALEVKTEPFTPQQLERLFAWLSAVGDFEQEVDRLRPWHAFFLGLTNKEAVAAAISITQLTEWFEQRSQETLGRYTEGVEQYLQTEYLTKRWQEDFVFCGHSVIEYHLNMVGAEILNRVFRPSFLQSRRTELLLPGCMRAKAADECKAAETTSGLSCVGCTAGCRVHQLTCLGRKQGFSVHIASHESEVLAQGTGAALLQEQVGVVGVACVPNLIAGGWKLQAHGIAAQCVLLECSGCNKHWHKTGKPTDLNMQRLQRVISKSDKSGQAVGE